MMRNDTANIEAVLTEYFRAASPGAAFAGSLEARLTEARPDADLAPPLLRRVSVRLRYALIAILVALSLTLTLIGPERVWAAIQQFWQRYIPGIGLVNETHTRVLAEPVVHTEAGVTFEVHQFVATAEDTSILIVITGLPEESVFDPGSVRLNSPDGRRIRLFTVTYGRVWPACGSSNCQELQEEPMDYELGCVFDPLPQEANSAIVTLSLVGLVPGADWIDRLVLEIPLSSLAEADDARFDQLIYSPDASLSIGDMNLTVTNVVQAEDRTVLDVTWSMPQWESVAQAAGVTLIDDRGRRFALLPRTLDLDENGQAIASITAEASDSRRCLRNERWVFEPVAPDASILTLEIEALVPRADAGGSFEFDLPANPQEGDLVPIGQTFDIAGGVLRVASVRFVEGLVVIASRPPTPREDYLLLEVNVDVVEQPPGGYYESVIFEAGWSGPVWMVPDPVYSESSGILVTRLVYDPDRIWSNHVRVHFGDVTVYQAGPWTLSWDVPAR